MRQLIAILLLAFATGAAATLGAVVGNRAPATPLGEAPRHSARELLTLTGKPMVQGENRIFLSDATGQVQLGLCPPWYRSVPVTDRVEMTVRGKLLERRLWRRGVPAVAVWELTQLGRTIRLRSGDVPPWAHAPQQPDAVEAWRGGPPETPVVDNSDLAAYYPN
jgi:hypothetical protein